ncbi:hypothetical protein Tco_0726550 [Tanacetum coccineum]|uniref:Uncharacterized protein n=1 Tax=Tanacetum coccineum TaxID=301880 RepID=A0ABQ4YFV3_9ASTR
MSSDLLKSVGTSVLSFGGSILKEIAEVAKKEAVKATKEIADLLKSVETAVLSFRGSILKEVAEEDLLKAVGTVALSFGGTILKEIAKEAKKEVVKATKEAAVAIIKKICWHEQQQQQL